jgi:NAD+ kinase
MRSVAHMAEALVIVKLDVNGSYNGSEHVQTTFWRVVRQLAAHGCGVWVEPGMMRRLELQPRADPFEAVLRTWDVKKPLVTGQEAPLSSPPPSLRFDVAVTVGGDGTLLWLSHLLGCRSLPPTVSINAGGLGFLAAHPSVEDAGPALAAALLQPPPPLLLRQRLTVRVHRAADTDAGPPRAVLNELLLRGSEAGRLSALDAYVDGVFVARLRGDGAIVTTSTGSTGHSLSAGGSIMHPALAAMQLTPLCPHALGLRPLVLPDSVSLRLVVACDATVVLAYDGRTGSVLGRGDSVTLTRCVHPLPTLCATDAAGDWAVALQAGLHYGRRGRDC